MNTVPVGELPGAAFAAEALSADQTGYPPGSRLAMAETSQAFADTSVVKRETCELGTRRGPVTPKATMVPSTSTGQGQSFGIRTGESVKVGTILNPFDFEYRPPRSQTSTQQSLRSSMPGMRKSASLCSSQITAAEDVPQENCNTMFDPSCATHDGRDRSVRKFGPNATVLKYPKYQNHPEGTFKPGYSEWRRAAIQPVGRETFVEAPKQRRQLSEWEKQQRREEAAEEARIMMNNFSSGIGSFKASMLPIGRCKMDLNDVAGQRAAFEYFPTVSTACRFPGCRGPGECVRG